MVSVVVGSKPNLQTRVCEIAVKSSEILHRGAHRQRSLRKATAVEAASAKAAAVTTAAAVTAAADGGRHTAAEPEPGRTRYYAGSIMICLPHGRKKLGRLSVLRRVKETREVIHGGGFSIITLSGGGPFNM
jgi:hypothetical protein